MYRPSAAMTQTGSTKNLFQENLQWRRSLRGISRGLENERGGGSVDEQTNRYARGGQVGAGLGGGGGGFQTGHWKFGANDCVFSPELLSGELLHCKFGATVVAGLLSPEPTMFKSRMARIS
jgi:hypothetical protein